MRILYFHQYYSTPEGSTSLRSYYMANALARDGHEVIIITGNYDRAKTPCDSSAGIKAISEGNITVVCLPILASNKDNFFNRILSFLIYAVWGSILGLRYPADLVLATSTPLTVAIPGVIIKKIMGIPFIFEVRDLWPDAAIEIGSLTNPRVVKIARWLEKKAYQQANSCIALAPGIEKAMNNRGANDVHFISNGAPMNSQFKANPTRFNAQKSSCAIYTGTLGRANNPTYLANICQHLLHKMRPDITVSVLGNGSEKQDLVAIKEQQSLSNLQLHEPVSRVELEESYSNAFAGLLVMKDITVFRESTSPNKFFDYLAAGLPVVCSYEGWIANLIREFECGLVIGNQNAGDFADALVYLYDNEQERRRMSENALKLLNEKFEIKKQQQKFLAVVNQYESE